MIYAFEGFKTEIANPTVRVAKVIDDVEHKLCSVYIVLTTNTTSVGVTLDGFTYTDTWEDADINVWVNNELKKYAV